MDDGGLVVAVYVFVSFHLRGEMGQELGGPNCQGTGEMNFFRRKAELAGKILESVKKENHLGFGDRELTPAINHLIETYGLDDAFEWITRDNYAVLVTYILESPLKVSDKPISPSPPSGKRVQRKLSTDGVAVVRHSDNTTELRSRPLPTDEAELVEPMVHSTPFPSDTDARKKQHKERHWPSDVSTQPKKAKISNIGSGDTFRGASRSQLFEPGADSVSPSSKGYKVKESTSSFGEMEQSTAEKRKWSTQTTPKRSSSRNEEPLSTGKVKEALKERCTGKIEAYNEPRQDNRNCPRDSPMKEKEGRRSRSAYSEKNALEKRISPTVMHEKVLTSDRRDFMEKKTLSSEKLKGTKMEHFRRKLGYHDDLAQDHRKVPTKQRSVTTEKSAFGKQNLAPMDSKHTNMVNIKNTNEENKTRPRDLMKGVSYKQTIPSEQLASALRQDHLPKADPSERVQGQFSNAKSNDSMRPCLIKPKKKSASLSENIIQPKETKIMSDFQNIGEAACVKKEPIARNYPGQISSNFLQELKTVAVGRLKTEMDPKAYQFFSAWKMDLEQRKGKAVVHPNLDCGEDQSIFQKGTSKTGQIAEVKKENQIVKDKKEKPAAHSDGDGLIVSLDISRGREKKKITCVNEHDDTCFPDNFLYITSSVITNGAHVDQSLSRIGDMHCSCSGDCLLQSTPCKCSGDTRGEYAYDKDGLLIPRLAYNYCSLDGRKNRTDFITECNVSCPCDFLTCGNRVVQRGLKYKLQVFMTKEGKGWGVRTLQPVPARAFLFEYIGEIMTNTEQYYRNIEYREKNIHTYTMLLDADYDMEINHFKDGLNDDEALTLDATRYGNVSRFVNHRCEDPNLLLRPVQIDTRDTHYYHVAFFASRDIAAMEELTWDYNINFDDKHEVKGFRCLCGSSLCRDRRNKGQKKG